MDHPCIDYGRVGIGICWLAMDLALLGGAVHLARSHLTPFSFVFSWREEGSS
jgi:hypothetical protein